MKNIIIDFDGVITDSANTQIGIINDLAARFHYQKIKNIDQFKKHSMKELIKLLKIPPDKTNEVVNQIRQESSRRYHKVKPFPEIIPVLQKLSEDHQLFVLSSNAKEVINPYLQKHQLKNLFTEVYSSKGLFDKDLVIKKIIDKFNLSKSSIAFIGDEARDIEAAHSAGIKGIAILWGFDSRNKLEETNPDHLCTTPKDLLKIPDF